MTHLSAEMIDDLVGRAAEVAAEMVGWPEDRMTAALVEVQDSLRASLSSEVGSNVAEIIARAFARTVVRRRGELQAAGLRDYGSRLQ